MDDATTQLADRLLDLRRKAGYSQEQLADPLGVSRQAISKWEGAQGRPEVDNVVKLAQIYRVSTDFILTGSASVPSVCGRPRRPLRASCRVSTASPSVPSWSSRALRLCSC